MAHAMMGEPFSVQLSQMIGPLVRQILDKEGVKLHENKTVVCMEGELNYLKSLLQGFHS